MSQRRRASRFQKFMSGEAPAVTPAKIMIVEDEGVVAMHLSATVSSWGYVVTSISATAELAISRAAEDPPDLVLMDINLKGEMDGIQATQAIRKDLDVPIIYLTAFADDQTLERAKATQPYGYALKPFNEGELKITIEMALYRHRADQVVKERGEWLDATLSSAGEAMIATDAEGRVMFINDQAEELTGWSRSEAFSMEIGAVLRSPKSEHFVTTEHFVERVLRKHSVISRGPGATLLTKAGEEIPIEDCAAPIRDSDNQVTGVVVTFRDASARRRKEAQLVHMAHHDALTGLANRVLFEDRLRQAIAHARRNQELVAVLVLDLDNFKMVNDTLGHAAGDSLLVAAADRVRACVRETDTVARLGGDELAVIQPDLDNLRGVTSLAQKLVNVFNRPFVIHDTEITTTASVGITVFPLDEQDPEAMVRRADEAMYRAKAAGRNRFNLSSDSPFQTEDWRHISGQEIRRGLECSEFEIYFQPIFNLVDRSVTGAEALIRWNHPKLGLISASKFIGAAEHHGLIAPIIDLSLKKACSAANDWIASAPGMKVSVNLSETDLRRRDLVTLVASILDGASLAPRHLELEVTERSSIERAESVTAENLRGLRDLGVPISLDGFGRDHASMLTMTAAPVGTVKIDRSLIKRLPDDPRAVEIVRATVDISKAFNVTVVAVGVETEEQSDSLRLTGCQKAQGNYLGMPMPMDEFFSKYVM